MTAADITDASFDDQFLRSVDPLRRELLAHCYRMVGSIHDAEDLVQETYLRAWRAKSTFEGRSSLRTWMYRIATRTCLTALEGRARRPLPSGLGGPSPDPAGTLVERPELLWLEPVPDASVSGEASDPATIATGRESIRLAFIAALQYLPPRQRAVLLLRDVLAWRAAEVAEALDITVAAANSSLQRARARLDEVDAQEDAVTGEISAAQRELLDRFVAAFEDKDIPAIVSLFTEDAVWEMPPVASWFRGRENIGRLIDLHCPADGPRCMRLVPLHANGQAAFGLYLRDPDGVLRAFAVPVLTFDGDLVRHVCSFFDTSLFAVFGLPSELPG